MNRFRQTILASSAIILSSLLLWTGSSIGQDTNVVLSGQLKSPAIVGTAIANVYEEARQAEIGPHSYPEGINPLTGLPYPDEAARTRRNLIVKVSNWPPIVRPQHAINQADLVYEYEAEGGVTRFATIYRSNAPEKVGSIRSARLLDIELINMYAALLAYSGTSGPIHDIYMSSSFRRLLLSPSIGFNCESAGFCRDESLLYRGYAHTLFGDTRKMWDLATLRNINIGYRAVGFAFALRADEGSSEATDMYINWYNRTDARWQYDEASQRYLRFSDGLPHVDAADDKQLWADNLVVLQVVHKRRPDLFTLGAIDESYEVALWGRGPAYVMREGQLYKGGWRRIGNRNGQALELVYPDGETIMLKPGRTWITVMRSLEDVEISNERADMSATAAVAIAKS